MHRFLSTLFLGLLAFLVWTPAQASVNADRSLCQRNIVACTIYMEARGESVKGQYGVAYVVHNRINDVRFPKTAKGVVLQKSQFSWTNKRIRIKDQDAFKRAQQIAHEVAQQAKDPALYRKKDFTKGAVYFNAAWFRTKHYKRNSKNVVKIGKHVFYGKVVLAKTPTTKQNA